MCAVNCFIPFRRWISAEKRMELLKYFINNAAFCRVASELSGPGRGSLSPLRSPAVSKYNVSLKSERQIRTI